MKTKIILFILLLFFCINTAKANTITYETISYISLLPEFYSFSPGARPASMGYNFVGVADDLNAVQYNPAGLTQIESNQLLVNYNFSQPGKAVLIYGGKNFGWEFSYWMSQGHYLDLGETFSVTDTSSEVIDSIILSNTPVIIHNAYVSFSFGLPIEKRFSIGFNIKTGFNISNYAQIIGYTIYFESGFGLLYKLDRFRIGIAAPDMIKINLQNDGVMYALYREFMEEIDLGISYRFLDNPHYLLVASDANMHMNYWHEPLSVSWRAGLEYCYNNAFYLRMGCSLPRCSVFDLGAGYRWSRYKIDYAFVPYSTHQISFQMDL